MGSALIAAPAERLNLSMPLEPHSPHGNAMTHMSNEAQRAFMTHLTMSVGLLRLRRARGVDCGYSGVDAGATSQAAACGPAASHIQPVSLVQRTISVLMGGGPHV